MINFRFIACSKKKIGNDIIGMQFVRFFYCVNDDKEADPRNPQIMTCLLCYNNHVHALNPNTKARKGLITYYKTNGTIVLKQYVDNDHATIGNLNK